MENGNNGKMQHGEMEQMETCKIEKFNKWKKTNIPAQAVQLSQTTKAIHLAIPADSSRDPKSQPKRLKHEAQDEVQNDTQKRAKNKTHNLGCLRV